MADSLFRTIEEEYNMIKSYVNTHAKERPEVLAWTSV